LLKQRKEGLGHKFKNIYIPVPIRNSGEYHAGVSPLFLQMVGQSKGFEIKGDYSKLIPIEEDEQ
jgi:hypothetical protein